MSWDNTLEIAGSKIEIKVREGTISSGPLLCQSCYHGLVMRDDGNRQIVRCGWGSHESFIKMKVVQCNRYRNRAEPSLSDMEEIAWRIVTDKRGGKIGFVDPSEFRRIKDREERDR